ncbi:MAG: 1-deoxy-D-xylulose-5-phosphate reductoisomerase, partial [Planctomycetota bacterium]
CVREGGSSGAVLNAADEVATQAFLERKISFPSIISTVGRVLDSHDPGPIESIPHVLEIDAWARREARIRLQPA